MNTKKQESCPLSLEDIQKRILIQEEVLIVYQEKLRKIEGTGRLIAHLSMLKKTNGSNEWANIIKTRNAVTSIKDEIARLKYLMRHF